METKVTIKRVVVVVILHSILLSFKMFGNDYSILRSRFYNHYITTLKSNTEFLDSMKPDGSWSDINYNDKAWTGWSPINHLGRLKNMCVSYNKEGDSYYNSDFLLSKIEKGLNYWYLKNPTSENWWYNEIGIQQDIMPILTLMFDKLSFDIVDKGISYLEHQESNFYKEATGQNLIWYSSQLIHKGMLLEKIHIVESGISDLASSLKLIEGRDEGGICPDFSFHQHYFLYNNGYGRQFTNDMSFWSYMIRNLSFSFSKEEINTLSKLILEGTQWMTFYEDVDYTTLGREVARKDVLNNTKGILKSLEYMMEVDQLRKDEYKKYLNHLKGAANIKVGNKHFWYSDYHSHRRDNYMVSVNMFSRRTIATEVTNNENVKGYFLASGAMFIESNHGSYYNIPPIWKWSKLPGVTCAQKENSPSGEWPFYGLTDFVGGVTDSLYGVAAMDYDLDNTSGKKSWFFFDDEIVALGAGIKSSNKENITTTLNQQLSKGDVRYFNASEHTHTTGEKEYDEISGVFHDNIAYIFPNKEDVYVSKKEQTGSWSDINNVYPFNSENEDVFTAWIDHGINPQEASYYYAIVPGIESDKVLTYIDECSVELLSNTSQIQAVRNGNLELTGIVFYEHGLFDINGREFSIDVNIPCILLLDEKKHYLSVVNPLQTSAELKVKFNYKDGTADSLIFQCPGGDYGGQSLKKTLPDRMKDIDAIEPPEDDNGGEPVPSCDDVSIIIEGEVTNAQYQKDNGSVNLTITGGEEPYSFLWNDGSSKKNRINLSPGEYSLAVIDNNSCKSETNFNIAEGEDPCKNFNVIAKKIDTEYGKEVGSIAVIVTGGTEPYTFSWSDNDLSQYREKLSKGTYTVNVNDVNNCSKELGFYIDEKTIPFEIVKFYPNSTEGVISIEYSSPVSSIIEIVVESMEGNTELRYSDKCVIGENKKVLNITYDKDDRETPNGEYKISIVYQGIKKDEIIIKKR